MQWVPKQVSKLSSLPINGSDFKLVTGVEARRFHSTATHTLSPLQLVAGSDRRIHHGICRARDAVQAAASSRQGCGLLDADFQAGFDFLAMCWTYAVLRKKSCADAVVRRLENLYSDNVTICVVNNVMGREIKNVRLSLRQGDLPSMYWFSVGLDPVLYLLDRLLTGILVCPLPPAGPVPQPPTNPCVGRSGARQPLRAGLQGPYRSYASQPLLGVPAAPQTASNSSQSVALGRAVPDQPAVQQLKVATLQPLEERYKLYVYADDLKCSISSMSEFGTVIESCALLERASGVKLHRDVNSGKVRFLPLGRWQGNLHQEGLPYQFIQLSDTLDFLGVSLKTNVMQTRKENCDVLETKVRNTIGPWKGGKFMEVTNRGHSVNCYVYIKVFFKCASIPLRENTLDFITTQARSWVFQDFFEKPAAVVLHRSPADGGLGLLSVKCRALAMLLHTFCELSCTPGFQHSLYLETLYRTKVLGEYCTVEPRPSPYYDEHFFNILRHYHDNSPYVISNMKIKDWYTVLLRDRVTHSLDTPDSPATSSHTLLPVHCEVSHPEVDWPHTWHLARLRGLPPDLSSHLFRQLHGLLPTQVRVARLGGSRGSRAPGVCRLCVPGVPEDLYHAIYGCSYNRQAGPALLASVQQLCCPGLTPQASLFLNTPIAEQYELPVVTLLATGFKFIWDGRVEKKPVSPLHLRAELVARLAILRTSRFRWVADMLQQQVQDFPT